MHAKYKIQKLQQQATIILNFNRPAPGPPQKRSQREKNFILTT
jgi:hypothetical protein